MPAEQLGRVHFVGIGGAGMSGIARIMLARGLPVSGSDAKDSVTLAALRALGATVHVGHAAAQRRRRRHRRRVDGDPRGQPRARRGTPARAARRCHRAGALASVMVGRRAVAVAGTHGKTTTTSLLTVALQHCGADPSFAIGGNLNESGANAHNGTGDVFVAEADESDGSFLLYSPTAADRDQRRARPPRPLRHRRGGRSRRSTRSPTGSSRAASWSCCADDPGAARLAASARAAGASTCAPTASARTPTCGWSTSMTRGLGSSFEAVLRGRRLGRVELRLPGRHNALNAAAALAVGRRARLPGRAAARGAGERSPAPAGGSSTRAPSTASASTTATPTTRPS